MPLKLSLKVRREWGDFFPDYLAEMFDFEDYVEEQPEELDMDDFITLEELARVFSRVPCCIHTDDLQAEDNHDVVARAVRGLRMELDNSRKRERALKQHVAKCMQIMQTQQECISHLKEDSIATTKQV